MVFNSLMKFFLNEKNYLCLNCNLRVCLDRTYFAETENRKHCNKIIFKCMNSAVGPIFNEKVTEKWNLWVHKQCTDTLFKDKKSTSAATKKKKKGWNALKAKCGRNKPNPDSPWVMNSYSNDIESVSQTKKKKKEWYWV